MRRWIVFAVAVPVGAWLLERAADRLAQQRGEDHVTALLRAPARWRRAR
jgi:hypothetical protein